MRSTFAVLVFLAAALFASTPALAQTDGAEVLEEIRSALERGDAGRLVEHGSERIDVTIFGTSELLSRSQATYVIRSFLREYPPSDVRIIDTSSADGHWFASAGYRHQGSAAPFSVYVRLRQGSERWELRELRVDRSPPR